MIKVENLTKKYAGQTAIRDLNFEVGQGEIVGFLGPNGAGKTTTMRILTSFLPATSGVARVAGHDVMTESMQVRRNIGYLPESVPLYPEMRVEEYLTYRAQLRGMPRKLRTRAELDAQTSILVEVRAPADQVAGLLHGVPGVAQVAGSAAGDGVSSFEVHTHGNKDLREEVAKAIGQKGWPLRRLELRRRK